MPATSARDGRRVAVYCGDRNEIWLYALDPSSKAGKVFRATNRLSLDSRGRRFYSAAFDSADQKRILISSQPAPDPGRQEHDLSFNFARTELSRIDDRSSGNGQGDSSGEWHLSRQSDGQRYVLTRRGENRSRTIELDSRFQGRGRCHAWLRDAEGKVYGIAIGTSQQNGIFAYSLEKTDSAGRCKLLRYFRDHRDQVTSLDVSRDGELLLSSSLDHTIKVWSLRGLQDFNPEPPNVPGWGAEFRTDGDQLKVFELDENGIAAQRGFRDGDIIQGIEFKSNKIQQMDTPDAMLDALRGRPLWHPLRFTIDHRDGAEPEKVEIYAAWQPLLSLFVAQDDAWVVWTPQGYYDASAIGDEYIGWVQNRGRDQEPDYFQAAHLRPELEKPDVIRQLFSARTLSGAFKLAGKELPADFRDPVPNLIDRSPVVRLVSADVQPPVEGQTRVHVTAEVLFASPQDVDRFLPKVFLNQHSMVPSDTKPLDDRRTVRYQFEIDALDPQVFVQIKLFDKDKRAQRFSHVRHEDGAVVETTSRLQQLKVHFIGIGGSKYPCKPRLTGVEDIQLLRTSLEVLQRSSQYRLDQKLSLLEENVKPDKLSDVAAHLRCHELVHPNDLLIVAVSGHGHGDIDGFRFVPSTCDPTRLDATAKAQRCIAAKEFEALAELNCRRLFIVDTCFAGRLGADLVWTRDDERKAQVRSWRNQNVAVWCATNPMQQAFQNNQFMKVLVDAIRGDADQHDSGDKNGFVTLSEANAFVANEFEKKVNPIYQEPKLYLPHNDSPLAHLDLFGKLNAAN